MLSLMTVKQSHLFFDSLHKVYMLMVFVSKMSKEITGVSIFSDNLFETQLAP